MNITKSIAILIVLLLATSFVMGNIFADYKAKKIASDYKETANKQVLELKQQSSNLMSEQEFAFVRLALQQGVGIEKVEPMLQQNGMYLVSLNSMAKDTKENIDLEYLMWIDTLRKPERRIFHFHPTY